MRHGEAVASAAIIAGYALATERRLGVFVHGSGEDLVDLQHLSEPFESADELIPKLRVWLSRRSTDTVTDPVTAWRRHLQRAHAKLVPFFEGAADKTLADVYVDLELDHGSAPLSVQALVERHSRAAILGEPGAGKTTLVRHLAWQRAMAEAGPVPVFLPLARHRRDHQDPAALAEAETGIPGLAAALRLLPPGELWVFLDGLDEIPQERMATVRDQITVYADAHPGVRILVTGRHIAEEVGAIPPSFTARARVRRLDHERQKLLLGRLLGVEAAAPLVADLATGRARWADFATNPLLLTLVAVVAREQGVRGGGRC